MSRSPAMPAENVCLSSEFEIFARKPIQNAVLETIETVYKHCPRGSERFGISDACQ